MPNSLVAVATDESGHYLTTGHSAVKSEVTIIICSLHPLRKLRDR